MSEEMNLVNTWCNETEVLLDEYDVMEQKLQDLNVGYKSGAPQETEQEQVKTETKKEKRARIKEEKAELREDMIQQIEKLSVSSRFCITSSVVVFCQKHLKITYI